MFGQIGTFLVDTVVTFFVFLFLARFLFQTLRVSFRNPMGEFLVAMTAWSVTPARRFVPGLGGIDLTTLLLAWFLQALGLWLQAAMVGADIAALAIVVVALIDLARYMVYILVFVVIVQAVMSWINPDAPLAPVFDALARPFLRPLRRFVPPIGAVDLTPLILLVILQVLLIPINYLRIAAAGLS